MHWIAVEKPSLSSEVYFNVSTPQLLDTAARSPSYRSLARSVEGTSMGHDKIRMGIWVNPELRRVIIVGF